MAQKTLAIDDFSEGMKGRTGQFKSLSEKGLQDINNFYLGRDKTLIQRNGLQDVGINTLPTDKMLTFIKDNKRYYVVYDTLLKHKFYVSGSQPSNTQFNGVEPPLIDTINTNNRGIFGSPDYMTTQTIAFQNSIDAVSYTHLTLPTILRV